MLNKYQKALLIFFVFGFILLPQAAVLAVEAPKCAGNNSFNGITCVPVSLSDPAKEIETASGLVQRILETLLLIVGLVAVIFVVVGGYRYITAGGEEEKVGEAKKTITNALIGIALVLLAFALVRITLNLAFNKDCPSGKMLDEATNKCEPKAR